MDSKEYIETQFQRLKTTKYGFSVKIFDGDGNATNQMELTPNRAREILEVLEKRKQGMFEEEFK